MELQTLTSRPVGSWGGYCNTTIINWIKHGKLEGTRTPTGRYLVCVDDEIGNPADRVSELLRFLES
ncbi:hypothetical protein AB6C88_25050 [Vibrio splendidus]